MENCHHDSKCRVPFLDDLLACTVIHRSIQMTQMKMKLDSGIRHVIGEICTVFKACRIVTT